MKKYKDKPNIYLFDVDRLKSMLEEALSIGLISQKNYDKIFHQINVRLEKRSLELEEKRKFMNEEFIDSREYNQYNELPVGLKETI